MLLIHKFKEEETFRTLCLTLISGVFLLISFMNMSAKLLIDPAWVAIVISGTPIVYGAVKGLIKDFDVTADVLVAIALIAAVLIGQFFAAGEVAFIMQLGKVLEDFTAGRAHKSLQALIRLTPQKACIRTPEGEFEILASEVKLGDQLLVRPGESIPVDARIIRGSTTIDQSIMTGESYPVQRTVGDDIFQGTFNQHGAIDIEATRVGEDSSLQKMIRLVEEAQQNKAPIVRIADQWARILVPVALLCSLAIGIFTKDIYRAVTALVVFCPCSLILATPTAMMAAIGNATKKGILIKSGSAIEAIAKMNTLVMDKTGTMTYGKLLVDDIFLLDQEMTQMAFVKLVASAEKFSEHPLAKAIVSHAENLRIIAEDPESFDMKLGKGVVARVDGKIVHVGEKLVRLGAVENHELAKSYTQKMQSLGKTVLPVSINGKLQGLITISDMLRLETKATIAQLRVMGISKIVMITGDNAVVANAIGSEAGVTDIIASQLPEGKVSAIKQLTEKGHTVGMLGDGVNDAPALASATVGIVMGAIGSDVAIEAADIALLSDDISRLPFLVKLCQKTKKRIVFNIVISMFINFGAIILAGYGLLNPVTAALVHNFGSVFVVVNSALLLTYKEETIYVKS